MLSTEVVDGAKRSGMILECGRVSGFGVECTIDTETLEPLA